VIRAVTFDLWNTLLCDRHYADFRIEVLRRILDTENSSKDRESIRIQYVAAIRHFNEAWRRKRDQQYISATKVVEFVLRNLGAELSPNSKNTVVKGFEEAILSAPPPLLNGVEAVLKSLSRRYRIGLISNSGVTPGRVLRRVLDSHAILQHFGCATFSDEVGYTKPNPIIFRRTVEELHVNPNEAIHVGDLIETDIVGAKSIGMKTVWFNTSEAGLKWDEFRFQPDYQKRDLPQLLKFL